MSKKQHKKTNTSQDQNIQSQEELLLQVARQAQEKEKRALADYQNLLRRVEGERNQIIRFANKELLEEILPILNHLQEAAQQIQDQGLNIVVGQFKQVLKKHGVEEVEALGKEFDLETMEAVDKQGEGNVVIKVMQKGYKLKDQVLSHARVILGTVDQLESSDK